MKQQILPYILQNAIQFKGSVNPKAVLGQVLKNHPELKSDVPKVLQEINTLIQDVTSLDMATMQAKLDKIAPELTHEKKEETKIEGPLKPLKNATKGDVVVRIAPSPSGPLHIGHAYGAALNATYAQMYNGKFIVRIEDTNPENIYDKAYELIPRDAKWLMHGKETDVIIQSERLDIYYDYAQKLVNQGNAYVCECNADVFRELKAKGQACSCRNLSVEKQKERYAKMFDSYAPGEVVLRLKTNINHKNPAMRDFAIMRINDHVHPKTGTNKRVWPLMIFSVAVDDHDLGVTHVLNGKDHADNAKKETMIMDCFSWDHPQYQHWGRINFEGLPLSSSKTRLAIEQGEFTGWDDIRLPFLPALRRRGYQPEAFSKFAAKIGLSLTDKTVAQEEFWKMVNAFNKEIIDPKANRYFVVIDPVQITINGAPTKKVVMNLHDDFKQRGTRELEANSNVLISQEDSDQLQEARVHRLIDFCNINVANSQYTFVSENYEEYKNNENRGRIIHWLPTSNVTTVEIMLTDGSIVTGKGEAALLKVKEGDIVQLERMFFARVDKVEDKKIRFWQLHS